MKRPPREAGAGREQVIPESVPGHGVSLHVRQRLQHLARLARSDAEAGKNSEAALAVLDALYQLGIRAGVQA